MRTPRLPVLVLGGLLLGCPSPPAQVKAVRASVDFGERELMAGTQRLPLSLTNTGGKTARLTALSVEGSSEVVIERPVVTLEPDQSSALLLAWTPTREAPLDARLVFDADDGLGPRAVTLHGAGVRLAATAVSDTPATCAGQLGALDFGTVTAGVPVDRTITLTSTGSGSLTILRADTDLDAGLFVVGLDQPITLDAGAWTRLAVHDDPLLPGPQAGTITFHTTSLETPTLTVPFCGSAKVPRLCVDPQALDLGAADAGASLHGQLVVTNCGNLPLQLTGASVDPDGGFFLAPPPLPTTLQPQESRTLSLGLETNSAVTVRSLVHLTSDSPATPTLSVPVGANLPPPCTLSISPTSLTFQRDLTPTRTVRLSNQGATDCLLERAAISPATAPFTIDRLPTFPATLPAHGAFELSLSFHPSTGGSAQRASLELELDQVHHVPLVGNAQAPAGCHLVAEPAQLSFGTPTGGLATSRTFTVRNVGAGSCLLGDLAATAPFQTYFYAPPAPLPSRGTVDVAVYTLGRPTTQDLARVTLASNDPQSPLVVPIHTQSTSCEPSCVCGADQTLSLWRFSEELVSAVGTVVDAGAPPFLRTCEPSRCEVGKVAVQLTRDAWQCTTPPPACPGQGQGYDFTPDAGWSCSACDLVVQFGSIYDGDRFCAPKPPTCSGGSSAATFDVGAHQWQCKPTCNNGSYDQRRTPEGALVCVPC